MSQFTSTTSPKINEPVVKTFEIFVGPKTRVTTDPKSKTKVINFPFDFPDKEKGVLIVCRLSDGEWIPANDIAEIAIVFK